MATTLPGERLQRSPGPAALFVLSCMWIVVSLAGGRLAGTLSSAIWYDLSRQLTTAAMLFVGFYLLARLGVQDLRPLSSIGFVQRPGLLREVGIGVAVGWAVAIALVLPALLSRNMVLSFDTSASAVQRTLTGLLLLVAWAFVLQLILSGLPVRLLVRSTSPTWTVTAVLLVAAGLAAAGYVGQGRSLLFLLLTISLFLTAFLRTRAIWLPLGLQIGWTVSLQMLFGATSSMTPAVNGVVGNAANGPVWLTGGPYGPEASVFGVAVLLAALVALFRVTRTYAWHYTYQPIVAAGYPMDVRPPAEHVREEQRASQSAPLVQIGGITSAPSSVPPTREP